MQPHDQAGELLKPDLRSANRTHAPDFSMQSALYTFTGIVGVGDTVAQPVANDNLKPYHIGAVPGQPVVAYLVLRDILVTVFANGGTLNINGTVIYRDPYAVEHYLCAIGTGLAIGTSIAYNNDRMILISERGLDEKERTNFGSIFVRLYQFGGAGSGDIRVHINYGVQYGL